jgi:hypothetical protein
VQHIFFSMTITFMASKSKPICHWSPFFISFWCPINHLWALMRSGPPYFQTRNQILFVASQFCFSNNSRADLEENSPFGVRTSNNGIIRNNFQQQSHN